MVILMPVFSDACNRGTPTRSKQRDDKYTRRLQHHALQLNITLALTLVGVKSSAPDAEQVSALLFRCVQFGSPTPRTALEMFHSNSVDAVILDYRMPGNGRGSSRGPNELASRILIGLVGQHHFWKPWRC